MTRSILSGLLALICVGAVGVVPTACQSGGVGDPCVPEDEYNPAFPGFKIEEENIESRSFQCATRICLVNHFKGRVSCPLGQTAGDVITCDPSAPGACGANGDCVEAQVAAPECTPCADGKTDCATGCPVGTACNKDSKICECTAGAPLPPDSNFSCVPVDPSCKGLNCALVLKSYVCHKKGNCQTGCSLSDSTCLKENQGKQCCVPGTDTPVTAAVCGQCEQKSNRDADGAVYCSCRCCPQCCDESGADPATCEKDKTLCGSACDPNFNYCSCPDGFTCSEIRKNVGLGDAQLTGAYCIKKDSKYTSPNTCGAVAGNSCI